MHGPSHSRGAFRARPPYCNTGFSARRASAAATGVKFASQACQPRKGSSMNAPLHREIPAGLLDSAAALSQVSEQWDRDIVRQLTDYIAVPAKSPGFDPEWVAHGYIETVV